MTDDLKEKTKQTAKLYFDQWDGEVPFQLWKSFDPGLARDLSLFITGKMYARQKLDHPTRQLVAVSALAALERTDELALHIHAARNVGVPAPLIAEAIFQVAVYAGVPVVNSALKTLKSVLEKRGEWPMEKTE